MFVSPSLDLLVSVCGLIPRLCLVRPARGSLVVSLPLLRAWVRMTGLVPSVPSTRNGMTHLRLYSPSFESLTTLEEPAGIAPNRCKTSLAPVYSIQSESSPALHLPTSPLLESLLEDVDSALAKFVEDQTVHGFILIPSRRHRRYYRTSSSSFPGPYSVPSGLASITLERVSETKKRFVSLSHSQVSSLETLLLSVCEVTSWLDWWLSTCGGFREHLSGEVRGNFERLMLSGSRALEFLGGQGVVALGNLVISRRDSLLLGVRSTVPAEEVARLRHAPLPSSASL